MCFNRFCLYLFKIIFCLFIWIGSIYVPSAFAQYSFNDTCITYNKQFIARYFTGVSQVSEITEFFNCLDNTIQFFLNHTSTAHSNYYTQKELTNFMQYMGFRYAKAARISQAVLNIKKGLMGGDSKRLSTQEVQIVRQVLFIVKKKMHNIHPFMPALLSILNRKNIYQKASVLHSIQHLRHNIEQLGKDLSQQNLKMNLSILQTLPHDLQTLGFSTEQLKYWEPSLKLIWHWRNLFSAGPANIISGYEWKNLLSPFGGLVELWFYYQAFLEKHSLLSFNTTPHTQYFISRLFHIFSNSYSSRNDIPLTKVDTFLKSIWFFPWLSTPLAKLSMRAGFCFVLDRLAFGRSCEHKLEFNNTNGELFVGFGDLDFMVAVDGRMQMSLSKNKKGVYLTRAHVLAIRHYIRQWIQAENVLRQKGRLPSLFGDPNSWLRRNIHLTLDQRLLFRKKAFAKHGKLNSNNLQALLSHLNWQSHIMQIVSDTYGTLHPEGKITEQVWNQLVQEWSILATAFYPGTHWKTFQSDGFSFFSLGDFLTANANGDNILQDKELLELFSLSMSAWQTVLNNQNRLEVCQITRAKWDKRECVLNALRRYPEQFFLSFPALYSSRFNRKRQAYLETIRQFKDPLENIFTVFVLIYYQENMMEYLDKDLSGQLDLKELQALLPVFSDLLVDEFPFVSSQREIFSVVTYLFHHGQLPIFTVEKNISDPIHFADWVIRSEQWSQQLTERKNILKALIYFRDLP